MNKLQIRVLIVEDDLVDRMACRRALSGDIPGCEFEVIEAETAREGLELARKQQPDCVLLDYHLPDLDGLDFLDELRNEGGEIAVPVMMLTGTDNASVAVEALRRGAQDYLVKDSNSQHLELLSSVIQRVLRDQQTLAEKRRMEAQLAQAEEKYRLLVEQIPAITYTASAETPGKLLYVSPQLRSVLGYEPEEWISRPGALLSCVHPDDQAKTVDALERVRDSDQPQRCEYRLLCRDGNVCWFLDEACMVHDTSGQPLFVQGILVDITADKQVEEELRLHRRHIDELVEARTAQLESEAGVLRSANASMAAELRALRQGKEEVG